MEKMIFLAENLLYSKVLLFSLYLMLFPRKWIKSDTEKKQPQSSIIFDIQVPLKSIIFENWLLFCL